MNKPLKLWEILAALIPVVMAVVIWLYNLGTIQKQQELRLNYVEKRQNDYEVNYRQDIKEINDKLNTILIKLESKQDRK